MCRHKSLAVYNGKDGLQYQTIIIRGNELLMTNLQTTSLQDKRYTVEIGIYSTKTVLNECNNKLLENNVR